jgi:hypothetical protein
MRRLGHMLVLAWVFWSTTSLDNDPRLLLTDWLFRVQPFPADSRPADAYATESDCKAALERHMAFLKTANDSFTPGQWRREGNDSVSPYFPTKMITMRNHLECREQR